MSVFQNTSGWKKLNDWIIERPDKVPGTDKGYILSGLRQSLYVNLNNMRFIVEARWSDSSVIPFNDTFKNANEDASHESSYVILCDGNLDDRITIFSLNTFSEERKVFRSIDTVRITPINPSKRIDALSRDEQIMSGVIYYDEEANSLGIEICVDRDAFMDIFNRASVSPFPVAGSLHLLANVYYDEVDRFFEDKMGHKDFGLLADDKGRCVAKVGVERMSISLKPKK